MTALRRRKPQQTLLVHSPSSPPLLLLLRLNQTFPNPNDFDSSALSHVYLRGLVNHWRNKAIPGKAWNTSNHRLNPRLSVFYIASVLFNGGDSRQMSSRAKINAGLPPSPIIWLSSQRDWTKVKYCVAFRNVRNSQNALGGLIFRTQKELITTSLKYFAYFVDF